MSKQREALKLALDTLRGWIGIDEWIWPVTAKETCKKNSLEAIAAIREALAEPEPEPVAWLSEGGDVSRSKRYMDEMGFICKPLYTAPPVRKPLTESQILELLPDAQHGWTTATYGKWVARAIERAHGVGGD